MSVSGSIGMLVTVHMGCPCGKDTNSILQYVTPVLYIDRLNISLEPFP